MTYEYKRTRGGLGALGWSANWEVPMSKEVARSLPCAGDGTIVCATPSEQQFMLSQSCQVAYPDITGGTGACRTSSGVSGHTYCCPPGRPGTGTGAAAAPVEQLSMSRQDIMSLQSYVNGEAGCSAGTVDGKWGPNTQHGVECLAEHTSWTAVLSRFPFVTTLMATPEGRIREPYVFDPGEGYSKPGDPGTTQTPEQAGVARVATSLQAGQQAPAELLQQPSLIARIPWWGWLGIAGGFGLLVVLGMAIYQSGEEEAGGLPSPSEAEEGGYWDWSEVKAGL